MKKSNQMKGWCTAASMLLCLLGAAQTVSPYLEWTFDGANPLQDVRVKSILNTKIYGSKYTVVEGAEGKGIDLNNASPILLTYALNGKIKNAVAIEFYFKGQNFVFQTFPSPHFLIRFQYPYVQFKTTALVNNANVPDDWKINLTGTGRKSYDYYTDGNWHHWVFMVDVQRGIKQLILDGQQIDGFSKTIKQGSQLVFDRIDGFRNTNSIDQLAFYKSLLPVNSIQAKVGSLSAAQPPDDAARTASRDDQANSALISTPSIDPKSGLDRKEFAPGYPAYTTQAIDQLKSFPDPRYSNKRSMKRNFPWLDIAYLHRELPGSGGKGFGKASGPKAVEMVKEMALRWNYYVDLPVLRQDSITVNKAYTTPGSLQYELLKFARSNPQYPTSSVIMQIQGKPVHANLNKKGSFASAQDLGADYYMKDAQGKVILSKNKKWLSPLAPLDIIKDDAQTTAFYLRQLTRYLGRPIDMLNENGEIFGHMRPESLLKMDPAVQRDMAQKKMNNAQYNGWFQNRLDTCYKNGILRSMGWKKTYFTFYNVSAYNSNYWPDYAMRRTTNMVINGNHYPTPAFYPARPDNWRFASGPRNGYGTVSEGRKREIALGDKLFAPFISAGWDLEEKNIRPAQWLALLKSMVMLGADFFHVGYFNVTGGTGWPNGVGPNDPRGYIYQVAMPSYAQAIGSRVYDFLTNGQLLNPQSNLQPEIYTYRFKGLKENQLILVRKMGNSYLIYGSIQPNSNASGNVQLEEDTRIQLEGRDLQFRIRRQGSMYVLNTGGKPVFYQLDGWHQYEYPSYWSKEVWVEAENADNIPAASAIATESKGQNDYRSFTTWVTLSSGQSITIDVPSQQRTKMPVRIRVRSRGEDAAIVINGSKSVQKSVTSNNWAVLTLSEAESSLSSGAGSITIKAARGSVDIDWVKF